MMKSIAVIATVISFLPYTINGNCLLTDGRWIEETNAINCADSATGLCICCGQNLIPFAGADSPVGSNWCCNGNPFNTNNQVCCGLGAWQGDTCCGTFGYDSHTQFCCHGQLGRIGSQTCCGGRVVAVAANGRSQCCASLSYDPHTQVCCGGNIFNGQSCCGYSGIDPRTQMCCGGKAVYRSDSYSRCCGEESYNPQTQVCCGGVVLGTGNACCGHNPYDATRQICCGNQISWLPYGSARCCGTESYDANQQSCCSGSVVHAPACYSPRGDHQVVIEQRPVVLPVPLTRPVAVPRPVLLPQPHPVAVPHQEPHPIALPHPVAVPHPLPHHAVGVPRPAAVFALPQPLSSRVPQLSVLPHPHPVGHVVAPAPRIATVVQEIPPVVGPGLTNGSGFPGNPRVEGQTALFQFPWQKKAAQAKAAAAAAAAKTAAKQKAAKTKK